MGYRTLKALLAFAMVPGAALAQTAPGNVPTLSLQHAPAARAVAPAAGHWHVARPRGWVWGRPGWWGGSYQPPMAGYVLPSFWLSPDYVVPDWAGYGFGEPGRGRRWVRYYDDAVLVDGRGMIYDSIHDVQWGRYSEGPVPTYVGGTAEGSVSHGATYGYDYGYDDEVTWQGGSSRNDRQIWAWPGNGGSMQGNPVIVVPPGSTTTIIFQPQQVITTTTSTDYDHPASPVRKAPQGVKEQPRSNTPPRVIGRVPVKKG